MIPKKKIAASFSQAAAGYDASAQFQRDVGNDLLRLLPAAAGGRLLDLGSGTGALHPRLLAHVQPIQSVGSDLAQGMSLFAKTHLEAECHSLWVTSDAEAMPFPSNSFNHIFANLSLQWCDNVDALAKEVWRVLEPQGILWYSTLVPGTLCELETSWAAVDPFPHVNDFIPTEQLVAHWKSAGFNLVAQHRKTHRLDYASPLALLHDLKGIGAHFMDNSANQKVTPPGKLKRMLAAYRQFQTAEGSYPATYEVLMLGIQKP